ncbi:MULTISPECIES: hypothetical protein [Streptomyces]|uniref:TetR family transcriptional regulator n=1 Tax=Streptomyces clavifer TaxID=68188 RepID=A0ABS4VHW8_9ACTN|nr:MULTISPECIES: hypothetical protein [Streptomyces]MBP2363529.1 hypothetical protein [Streptomyces clavifer]GHB28724.1 hypothetical protein GCM10010392_66090 [Streptomyces clavifer]
MRQDGVGHADHAEDVDVEEGLRLRGGTLLRGGGLLAPAADLDWTRQVYYALLGEAINRPGADQDPDTLATLVIDTLLHGAGRHD